MSFHDQRTAELSTGKARVTPYYIYSDMTAPTLRKRERMVSQKLIESLFNGEGSLSMATFPLRIVYQKKARKEHEAPVQLLISVPKKRLKHAVDRNHVKRQVREAFRQHKDLLYQALQPTEQLLIAWIWLSDQRQRSQQVEHGVVSLLQRVSEKL